MSSLKKTKSTSSSSSACHVEVDELRRGPWTPEEDTILVHYIARDGEGRWNLLAKRAGLRRTGKSCRLRWLNYLKPDVRRGNLTPQEQLLILELHSKWGNRWSKIAQHLPGRTDNEIKNYWRTRVLKQAKHLKIDTGSSAFQDIIRCFWMPRLLQKIGESSSTSLPSIPSQSPTVLSHQSTLNYASTTHVFSTLFPPAVQLPPPVQQHQEATTDDMISSLTVHCNWEHHEQASDSEHAATSTSCISSAESMNVSQMSQLSVSTPFHAVAGNGNCCEMEAILPAGELGIPAGDCHIPDRDWAGYDFGDDAMWNMDELWQFGHWQEKDL